MFARYLPIALASLILSTAFLPPAFAVRSSGRIGEPTEPLLTKVYGNGTISCSIYMQQDGLAWQYHSKFTGTRFELAQLLSDLRESDPSKVYGCW
jgi:hypothetical protein